MFEQSSRRLTLLSYTAGATTAFLLGVLGLQQWDAARWEASQRLAQQRSTERSTLVSAYLSSLRDVETGQRGFLVTADPSYLQPFDRALATLPAQTDSIHRAFAARDESGNLADELLLVGSARIERAKRSVGLVREGNRDEARAMVAEGTGKRLMDRARTLAEKIGRIELTAAQSRLNNSLVERADRQKKVMIGELAALLSLGVLLYALSKLLGNLRRTSATLRDSAARQVAIFEGATDAMMMLDTRGTIESANSATTELFGFQPDDLIGRSNLVLFNDPPSETVSQAYLARLASGHHGDNRQMFEGRRADGSTIEAEVVTTPIQLADGLHFLAVARDATERRQIERMKNEFVATVSHELRTPLTSIAGSLGLILGGAGGEIGEKSARLVQIAQNNCQRLIRLINDMLDIEKIESGKVRLSVKPIGAAFAIEQAMGSVSGLAEAESVTIEVSKISGKLQVMADPDRLTQILTNLLSNAVKYSPTNGTVRVSAKKVDDGQVRFQVRDEGPGIDEEFSRRIFQKFAQADSTDSRLKGGTGLGLSIVKELVSLMGGQVGFSTSPGKGSTFTFTLPECRNLELSSSGSQSLGRMGEDDGLQILHVDDDADTLRLVASAFDGKAVIHSSPSLQEAKAALERYDFDGLILDIAMPDGNGLELLDLIREGKRDMPVVLYTALDDVSAKEPIAFARLTKSKDSLDKLVETVEQAVKGGPNTI